MDIAHDFLTVAQELYENLDYGELKNELLWSPTAPLWPTLFFVISCPLVPKLSPEVQKSYLKPFVRVYDALMALFSFWCFLTMTRGLLDVGPYPAEEGCDLAWTSSSYRTAVVAFYYSKYVEYIDSWTLRLSGKKLSWLQWVHHLGAPWILWFGLAPPARPGAWTFVLLNSFVHTVMYSYYLATSFGWRTRLKPLVTVLQMTQFSVAFVIAWPMRNIPCMRREPRGMLAWFSCYAYVGLVYVFFANFFIYTYITGGKRGAKTKQAAPTAPDQTRR